MKVSPEKRASRLANESGQGMTEYILLIVLVSLVLIPFIETLPKAIRGYVRPIYYSVSRPLP